MPKTPAIRFDRNPHSLKETRYITPIPRNQRSGYRDYVCFFGLRTLWEPFKHLEDYTNHHLWPDRIWVEASTRRLPESIRFFVTPYGFRLHKGYTLSSDTFIPLFWHTSLGPFSKALKKIISPHTRHIYVSVWYSL